MRRREFDYEDDRPYRLSPFLERQRYMMTMLLAMLRFMSVFILVYLLFIIAVPVRTILSRYADILSAQAEGMRRIPDIEKQLNTLETRLSGLTTQSIETRLGTLEQAIRAGQIKPEDVATVQDLRRDLDSLKTYMFQDPRELVELRQLQRNYQEVRDKQDKLITKDEVMREVSFLQNMFYASTTLFGLLLAGIGGSWWLGSRKLSKMERLNASQSPPAKEETSADSKKTDA